MEFLRGSEIIAQEKTYVQDPYSLDAYLQVHGASKDALNMDKKKYSKQRLIWLLIILIYL
jgi:histidine ammonia-lyase